MLLHLDRSQPAPLLAAHMTGFRSHQGPPSWRRAARRDLNGLRGLVFAKAMPFIGSRATCGFGAGAPDLRRQVLLTAWRHEADFDSFLARPLGQRLAEQPGHSWWALFEIASTRGSHHGARPLRGTGTHDGPVAVLTLGRTRPRQVPLFLLEGARLARFIRSADGLITAFSAGIPLSGNCTVSVWESESDMLDFAYRRPDGHARAARRRPPILAEQLNARMRLRRLGGDWGEGTLHPERLTRLAARLQSAAGP
jgi:hypothetical protein